MKLQRLRTTCFLMFMFLTTIEINKGQNGSLQEKKRKIAAFLFTACHKQ